MRALPHPSLRAMAAFWIAAAFLAGVAAAWLWFDSQGAWREHLLHADRDGQLLYAAIETGSTMPKDLQAYPLTKPDAELAEKAQFISLSDAPRPALLTHIPVTGLHPSGTNMPQLVIEAVSSDLSYPVGRLTTGPEMAAQEMLGQIVRLLSTYCGDPLVVLRSSGGTWYRLDGSALWSCQAVPRDRRIAAMALGGFALLALLASASRIAHRFSDFASQLHDRQLRGGPDAYEREGPAELAAIVEAVNLYLDRERQRLSKRLMVLSGVSHDLGSPATRLRLRAALIEDEVLRNRFAADIERMTEMIDGVLAYTRSELNVETPRKLSLTALVEALVDDYRDAGQPVELRPIEPVRTEGARSLFSSRVGHGELSERQILVTARPMALQRAISNLIDNALKYGRRAHVSLEADAQRAQIVVEDEGGETRPEVMAALTAPFERGPQEAQVSGHGLGLTIAATVAEAHGGSLSFAQGARGLRVTLTIARG
ncbi:hypothetical protein BMI90_10265 [Thioclava sp. L04-15]|uniref:sensor histidine kinase n=1 Tax=Thioclava sp. L04-15 TaxID=1915318 RepID=UPI000996880F|nr:HAMP domain-containing sensor histidine kinase [Thioclava sp. L04-15]OOY27608.1 hypothetical protein BMI90_10265 [Thioclava sp. L04-15]